MRLRRNAQWLSWVALWTAIQSDGRAADTLKPGSDVVSCGTLTPGSVHQCEADVSPNGGTGIPRLQESVVSADAGPSPAPSEETVAADHGSTTGRSVTERPGDEREIDRFLADYGKPPRSAVRALLDPSDQNIAAMRTEQARQEIIAAYVAQRLTEMQAALAGSAGGRDSAYDALPYFAGARIVAYVPTGCRTCDSLYGMLRSFVEQNPVARVEVAVVETEKNVGKPLEALLDSALALPAHAVSEAQAAARGIASLPVLELEDIRTGLRRLIPPSIDAGSLREATVRLRKATP